MGAKTNVKRYKKESDVSYSLGITLTFELLNKKPDMVTHIYIHSSFVDREAYDKLIMLCNNHNVAYSINDKVFHILSKKENCYVIGEFKKYEMKIQNEENHVVLVNPSNAGNLGTIIRSCLGFGIRNIAVIGPSVDLFEPKVIRASMGAFFGVDIQYYDNFDLYLECHSSRSLHPFMLDAKAALADSRFNQPYSLIFGNEATGLPAEFNNIGESIIIRHSKEIDSLNLPIAVSIALYEATK